MFLSSAPSSAHVMSRRKDFNPSFTPPSSSTFPSLSAVSPGPSPAPPGERFDQPHWSPLKSRRPIGRRHTPGQPVGRPWFLCPRCGRSGWVRNRPKSRPLSAATGPASEWRQPIGRRGRAASSQWEPWEPTGQQRSAPLGSLCWWESQLWKRGAKGQRERAKTTV